MYDVNELRARYWGCALAEKLKQLSDFVQTCCRPDKQYLPINHAITIAGDQTIFMASSYINAGRIEATPSPRRITSVIIEMPVAQMSDCIDQPEQQQQQAVEAQVMHTQEKNT
ncbi:hypothetical protein [Pseudorhizobium flavum]|uniref:Uncharacterized protein n=1 Tax=Pseudorhizobium flavum TaxID=1335061 RepID=A0A7X0DEB2_9HYPH|nr:hypothetical protein [Pseudorhizobium flavum]MBB6181610.1 hypothetical protein [Pseudorhizobium flavum]